MSELLKLIPCGCGFDIMRFHSVGSHIVRLQCPMIDSHSATGVGTNSYQKNYEQAVKKWNDKMRMRPRGMTDDERDLHAQFYNERNK